jgi:hypothetical protein
MTDGFDLLVTVFLLALATGAVVDVWLNGSIFAGWRARAEVWENTLSELLGCSLCLNYQVPIWLTLGLWALPMGVPKWAAIILRGVLIALAVGRLAWLLNHMCLDPEHGYDRGSQTIEEDH